MHLPLLPTLATAALAAAVSLLCQEPSVAPAALSATALSATALSATALAEPARTAEITIEPTSFFRVSGTGAETDVIRPAAALAFARFHPLLPEPAEVRVAVRSVPRVAVLPPRRPCPGQRCGEGAIPRRANPFAAATPVQEDTTAADAGPIGQDDIASDGPSIPRLALPFAPAARIVREAAGMVRGGAAALGSSVVLLVDRLR